MPPSLVFYDTEEEYQQHYETHYCHKIIHTFDKVRVYFPKRTFAHAFYESANRRARDKSVFSRMRAERIDWIKIALNDPTAELYAGWLRDKKQYTHNRRVTVIYGDYVIVLRWNVKKGSTTFITAYVAQGTTISKIRRSPKWKKPNTGDRNKKAAG